MTLLFPHKQESAFFGQLRQSGAAVVYSQRHQTYSLGPVAPSHQCRYQPLLKQFLHVESGDVSPCLFHVRGIITIGAFKTLLPSPFSAFQHMLFPLALICNPDIAHLWHSILGVVFCNYHYLRKENKLVTLISKTQMNTAFTYIFYQILKL